MTTRADPRATAPRPGLDTASGLSRASPAGLGRADRAGAGPGGVPPRPPTADRFGGLLLLLVATYLLSAFSLGLLVDSLQVVLFLAVVLLALRTGRLHRRTARVTAVALLAGSAGAVALVLVNDQGPEAGVANFWAAFVLLLAVVFLLRRVLAEPEITLQSIYGAVSAYMILGLMFAAVYSGMNHFGGDTFFLHGEHGDNKTFQYFSFTTLTTLGYGDYTAAESGGQAVAVIEAMAGQIFLATLVARLVAGFRGRGASRSRSLGGARWPGWSAGAARGTGDRLPPARRAAARRRTAASGLVRVPPPGALRRRSGAAGRPPAR